MEANVLLGLLMPTSSMLCHGHMRYVRRLFRIRMPRNVRPGMHVLEQRTAKPTIPVCKCRVTLVLSVGFRRLMWELRVFQICNSCCWMNFCEQHDDCCGRYGFTQGPCWQVLLTWARGQNGGQGISCYANYNCDGVMSEGNAGGH